MLILPIVNRGRILNVEVKLKNASKVRGGIRFSDADESEVIVNGELFSKSMYMDDKSDTAIVDFIRHKSIRLRRNYLVTTREESSSSSYDVYEVELPPRGVSKSLDSLYASLVTDLRKEIPGHKRGRYLSLKKHGIDDMVSDVRLGRLDYILKHSSSRDDVVRLARQEGVLDLIETVDFLRCIDCTVVSDASINEESLQGVVHALNKVNTRDSRNLVNYYQMAMDNRDIYSKLSSVSKMVYGKPLDLIQSTHQKQKQLVKTEGVNLNAA